MYNDLFGRLPDHEGALFWMNYIAQNNLNVDLAVDRYKLQRAMMQSAAPLDCAFIGGTYDPVNRVCTVDLG
jgi:hypothetical protein